MKFFTYTRYSDAVICCISHVFFIISALWTSQAYHNWQLYLGLLISPFASYQGSLTYSIISKWLEPSEINNAYTFVTEINTILSVFGNSVPMAVMTFSRSSWTKRSRLSFLSLERCA